MSRTIEERIEVVVDEIDMNTLGLHRNDIRQILQQHFSEPWLGSPDGPGWWWADGHGVLTTVLIRQDAFDCGYWIRGYKWQRAIGPSL